MTTHVPSELSNIILNVSRKLMGKTPSIFEIETKTYRPTARRTINITETVWFGLIEEMKNDQTTM